MHTKSALAASVGGALEWYDFIVYGFFTTVLGNQFFPKSDEYVQHILIFVIFGVGYFARTIGGLIFGHIGDKHGRATSLTSTMLIGGVATICMALMPSYATLGIVASILFMLARVVQGLTIGANISGAVVYISELTTKKRRGFWVSTVFLGTQRGVLLAGFVSAAILSYLNHDQLHQWGWRVAFMVGVLVMFMAWYAKDHLVETPFHIDLRRKNKISQSPVKLLFSEYKKATFLGMGVITIFSVSLTFMLFYMPTFLRFYQFSQKDIIHTTFYNLFAFSAILPLFGWISDLIGPRKLLLVSIIILIVMVYPCSWLIISHNLWLRYFGLTILAANLAAIATTTPVILSGLFPTVVRYTGVGFTYNICQSFFLGISPLAFALAGHYLHSQQIAMLILFWVSAIVSLIALYYIDSEQDWLHKKEKDWEINNVYPH